MTIITKGMGAVVKKFGKKTATHMEKQALRHAQFKKLGMKGPKYKIGKKVKGSHHLDEVWTYDKNYKEKAKGGRIGFKQGGAYGPLRGTTAGGVAKAFRGREGFKESQKLQDKILKHNVKRIQKTPDKTFKYNNPGTRKVKSDRTGRWSDVQKKDLVKGSIGKKKYIRDWKRYHHASQHHLKHPKGNK